MASPVFSNLSVGIIMCVFVTLSDEWMSIYDLSVSALPPSGHSAEGQPIMQTIENHGLIIISLHVQKAAA